MMTGCASFANPSSLKYIVMRVAAEIGSKLFHPNVCCNDEMGYASSAAE